MVKDYKGIQQLLNQVSTISTAYNLVAKNTGENFNLFQILGMETAEVKTHSKFLAELLNPKGSHLQEDKFLSIFIKYLNDLENESDDIEISKPFLNNQIEFNSAKGKVEIEKHIGRKTQIEGGRVDISITDSDNRLICIENKIYAGEQENQLLRYSNFGNKFEESNLFFLTLHGNKCSTIPEDEGRTVYSISYKKHIKEWLELCKKEAVDLPILRETIGQYINLINKLTHQTTNKNMEKDLQNLIIKNHTESLLVYRNFEKSIFSVYNNILDNLHHKIKLHLQTYPHWEIYHFEKIKSNGDRGKIFIKPKFLKSLGGFGIEEFNPLCRHQHFGHKIFYGIINWNRNTDYLKHANGIDVNRIKECWINYEFPQSDKFDFTLSTMDMIVNLKESINQEQFSDELFKNFVEYFEKNQEEYLRFLNKDNIVFDDENFGENKVNQLQDVDKRKLIDYTKGSLSKDDYKNVTSIDVYEHKKSCYLVVRFNNFRLDFLLSKNEFFIQLINLELSPSKDVIISKNTYELLSNGRYEDKIAGNTINDVIINLKIRIKEIDQEINNHLILENSIK